MISRIWHGWTSPDNADVYENIVRTEVLPGIAARQVPGYHGAHLMRQEGGAEVEFVTIMWFDSLDNVRAFMGDDYEIAYVPQRAREVLSRFDTRAQHYEVLRLPEDTRES